MMKVTKAADPNQKDSIDKFKIKCSTVSGALGCFSEEDFAKKQYAQDEGHCQPLEKVPFPLPVHRRIGGLEMPVHRTAVDQVVHRRIGGLESIDDLEGFTGIVHRRIGGLENRYVRRR